MKSKTSPNYPFQQVQEEIISDLLGLGLPREVLSSLSVEPAPSNIDADLAIACFPLAKILRKNPKQIAADLAQRFPMSEGGLVASAAGEGGYLNFKLDMGRFGRTVIENVIRRHGDYGKEKVGVGQVVVIDMSSPNIAKPMSIGHLRSTVIGHSLARILEFSGHKVIRDNHLGDWGTQFGMLLKAYELWGDELPELKTPGQEVEGLYKLYVRIHDEVERAKAKEISRMRKLVDEKGMDAVPGLKEAYEEAYQQLSSPPQALEAALEKVAPKTELEEAGREWFRKLEAGDKEAQRRWEWASKLSLKEFHQIYEILGVNFDLERGESYYIGMIPPFIDELKKQRFVKREKGALVADLTNEGLGKMVIITGDGRTVYVTRDLAAAVNRQDELKATQILYVVGADQKLYFQQWFTILKKMGYKIAENCRHIYFGMITLPEGKMSTRKGRVVFLKDVIDEGIRRAKVVIEKKNPELFQDRKFANEISRQVAVGAIIWNDISKDMKRDIVFDWDEMLSFDGYAAPYVQYAYARGCSVLEKVDEMRKKTGMPEKMEVETPIERELIKKIADFPRVVDFASENYNPAIVAQAIYDLAKTFNQFYKQCSILKADEGLFSSRVNLVRATTQVIRNGLHLLGIEAPERM